MTHAGADRADQPGWRDLVGADVEALAEGFAVSRTRLALRLLVHARWRVTVYWRLAQRGLRTPLLKPAALWLTDRILAISGAELQAGARIGPGVLIKHTTGLVVGDEVVAGRRLTLHQNVTLGDRRPYGGQPVLGDDVTIGAGAVVLGPITLGDRVVVAANAVVLDDVPDDCVVAGAPARVVRQRGRAVAAPVTSMTDYRGRGTRAAAGPSHQGDSR
ncbi:serine O-acetyltransferase [Friedmanniella endophytica]|uniref:Serine O-acetyltransferase n=1 Tax=Microlunatus kandeliicorticis TaxID=1759536 RepID=A0A7W3P4T2_9ACTN|nr:DapH/DapD/GlmU-related protein [Microlunatus kandeliicorticis]MBA8793243.1 serine O-acetyltransferase [Microlunatus kandeliicorticis]